MKLVFMGSAGFAVPSLKALLATGHEIVLVVCQPDRPKGRGQHLQAPPLKVAAEAAGLSVFQPEKVKAPEAVQKIQEAGADLLIVVAYGQILPKAVLEAPRLMPLNVHASLLPKFRGAAPIEWAVAAGETETGVCVQKMVERLDAGDVLSVAKLAIGPQEGAADLVPKLAQLGADLLCKTLDTLEKGEVLPQPQDESAASYAPLLKKTHGIADFSLPAQGVYDRFRAFHERPGFYAALKGQTLKLLAMDAPRQASGADSPGTLVAVTSEGFEISCGDSKNVIIGQVQAAGTKAMPAADFARGHGILPGLKFEIPVL